MMTVPVQVPSDKALGSAEMVKLRPSGGMIPFDGATLSHGLSTVAKNDVVTLGRPGTRNGNDDDRRGGGVRTDRGVATAQRADAVEERGRDVHVLGERLQCSGHRDR